MSKVRKHGKWASRTQKRRNDERVAGFKTEPKELLALRRTLRRAVQETQNDRAYIIASMPDKAVTPGQRALEKKHGTPREFAAAVVAAIGEISVSEANTAIREYRDEWNVV